jgi:hypothetical protein
MCLVVVCTGKNSNISLAPLTKFPFSFILILPEILPSAQEWGFCGEQKHFSVVRSSDCSP